MEGGRLPNLVRERGRWRWWYTCEAVRRGGFGGGKRRLFLLVCEKKFILSFMEDAETLVLVEGSEHICGYIIVGQ